MVEPILVGLVFYVLGSYLVGFALFLTSPWLSAERLKQNRWYRALSPITVPYALLFLTWGLIKFCSRSRPAELEEE